MVMPTVEERRCTGYQAISELLRGMAEESDVTKFYSDVIGGVTIYALFSDGRNWRATPFMQYFSPVGHGPSLNTCPKCPSHFLHKTSLLMKSTSEADGRYATPFSSGLKKEYQPVPE